MSVTLNTKEQERKITIWAHKTLTLSKCLCNYVIFMTVAPEIGGCGGVGSQRTIPLSAQMIVVLQTLAPEGKKRTYCHPPSSKRGQCFSAKSNVTPTQSDSPTALRDTMGRIPYSGFTGN